MKIRAATNQDAASIRTIVFAILAEYGLEAEHEGVDADLDNIEVSYIAGGGSFDVVLDKENNIVGSAGLYPHDARTCELRKMYLLPAYRDKGIGKQLMNLVIGRARELGFQRIILETSSKLVEAIAMYQRYGFSRTEDFPTSKRCDQTYELTLFNDHSHEET